jgi:TonB family protein
LATVEAAMSIGQTFAGTLLLAISIVAFAQTSETKPPNVGTNNASPAGEHYSASAQDQAEILTDTMGVDFGSYLTRITQIVRQNWYSLMPPSVYPPQRKQGKLSIEFVILKDGKTTGMVVHTSSGDMALDRAAWSSITASTPFPPLPKEFPGQLLGLRFHYFYNLKPEPKDLRIAPSTDVRVPAGSNLQFSASGKALTDAWVDWSVSGSGCSKSACGTISNSGLYTAPVDIPSPPTVIVEAKSWTNGPVLTVKATSRVNVSITADSKATNVQVTSH